MSFAERLPALTHPEFRTYIVGGLISNVGNMIQATTVAFHVYSLTNSSVAVGMIGIVTVIPLIVFSLLGGVVSDHVDRRKMLLLTQSCMALVALLFFLFAWMDMQSLILLYGLIALRSVFRAFDGPTRQPLVASLVPPNHLANAYSINGITWRLSEVSGPVIAGLLLAYAGDGFISGLAMCYLLNFFTFSAVLYAIYRLAPRPPQNDNGHEIRTVKYAVLSIRDGFRFIRATPTIRSAMWIDFWATFFSGADALFPAFAVAVLGLGAEAYGILAASGAVGAMIAASLLAYMPPLKSPGKWIVYMIFAYGLAMVGFGFSPSLYFAVFFLAVAGAADMVSTVFRQTIRQVQTPDNMRGRVTATASLFHISGPRLGDAEAGALAGLTGERFAIVSGGLACMLVNSLWLRAKHLLNYKQPE